MKIEPTVGNSFFGRQEICSLLEKRFEAFQEGYRQNVGILGASSVGKSTLVRHFRSLICQKDLITLFFECHESESFERFSERWMGELLSSYHQKINPSASVSLSELIRSLRPILPRTLRQMKEIRKITASYRYDQAYRELLGLSRLIQEETGKKMVVIVDEFHRMGDLGLSDPFYYVGQEMMIQKETMYVVTSSNYRLSRSIFQSKLSLLFGNFEVVELLPFQFSEANQFIQQHFRQQPLDGELVRFLIRLTNGVPFYLDVLMKGYQSRFSGNESGDAGKQLAETLRVELFEKNGSLYQHFQSKLYHLSNGKPWPIYGDALSGIALGHKKYLNLLRFLHRRGNEVKKALEKMILADAIEKHGSIYYIPDPLFRFWLANVYYFKRSSLEADLLNGNDHLVRKVLDAVDESTREDQKELPKRIEELFREFNNDLAELNQRKFRCPIFNEVISKPNNGRVFPVIAKNRDIRWLCQVLSAPVSENDINVFLEDAKRLKSPIQKKIIFGLSGIDLNAKLLAQEEKIQYLDLKNLNFLLDIYDKTKIVID